QGVEAVAPAGRVVVAAGTYRENVRLSRDVLITGATAADVVVDGGGRDSVFRIDAGVQASLLGMTIQGGRAIRGGGLFNQGTLTLQDVVVAQNRALVDGGGLFNEGMLTATGVRVSGNSADRAGGGLASATLGGSLNLSGCVFEGNQALIGGGLDSFGPAAILNS